MTNQSTINIDIKVDDKGSISAIKKFGSEVENAGKKGDAAARTMGLSWKALAGTLAGVSFVAIGREILATADQYTLLESRLRLVTTGAENLASVQQSLYEMSLRTHQSNADTIDLYTRLARSTKKLGTSQSELLTLTESINQALLVSGANSVEAGAAIMQLGQGIGAGSLQGAELNSVLEQTPRLAQALADGLGVVVGDLKKMGAEGKLTSEVVVQALLSQKDAIKAEFGQMTTTVSQAMTDLQTVIKDIINDANNATGATGSIVEQIQALASTIDQNREGILSLFSEIIRLTGEAVQIAGNLGRSIQGMRAVAEGEISFFTYATSNAEELKSELDRIIPGVKEIESELSALSQKRKEVAESWTLTSAARQAKQDELKAIDDEINGLKNQKVALEATGKQHVDTWQKAAQETETLTTATKKSTTIQVKTVEDGETKKTAAVKKGVKEREKEDLSYGAFLKRQNVQNADNFIDGWRGAYERRIEVDESANEEIEQKNAETTSVIIDEWSNAFGSIQSTVADWAYEFEITADGLVNIVRRTLAEIFAAILMSGIKAALTELFDVKSTGSILGAFTGGIGAAIGLGGDKGGAAGAAGGALSLAGAGKSILSWLGIETATPVAAGAGLTAYSAGAGATAYGTFQSAASTQSVSAFSAAGMGTVTTLAAMTAGVLGATAAMRAMVGYMPTVADELARVGTTAADIAATGLSEQMQGVTDQMRAMVPALANVSTASFDAETATLRTVGALSAFSEAQGEGELAAVTMTYAFDALTGTWRAGAEMITEYDREVAALNASIGMMANTTSMAASTIADSAGSVYSAFKSIAGVDIGALGSHLVGPSSGDLQHHATGGVFTKPARIGSHIFGESGMEGLLPLPEGRDTLTNIIKRLDRIEAKQPIVQVYIGNEQFYGKMRVVADTVAADRQSAGVQGRAYV